MLPFLGIGGKYKGVEPPLCIIGCSPSGASNPCGIGFSGIMLC